MKKQNLILIIFFIILSIVAFFIFYLNSNKVTNHSSINEPPQATLSSQVINEPPQSIKNEPNKPIEFVYTKEESEEISQWANKTMEELVNDALTGNKTALYNVGLIFLLGGGVPIDVEAANLYFSKSASFGFAPALDKLKSMYLIDYQNPFLAYVYINLTIAFGHPEFILTYHKLRDEMTEKLGYLMFKKIEKIASRKYNQIIKNKKSLEESDDKVKFLFSMPNITDEDTLYSHDYWEKIFKKSKVKQ